MKSVAGSCAIGCIGPKRMPTPGSLSSVAAERAIQSGVTVQSSSVKASTRPRDRRTPSLSARDLPGSAQRT